MITKFHLKFCLETFYCIPQWCGIKTLENVSLVSFTPRTYFDSSIIKVATVETATTVETIEYFEALYFPRAETLLLLPFKEKRKWSLSVLSDCLRPYELYSPSPGHSTGVGHLPLLQGVFPTHGSNPGLPYCGWVLCQLSHQGSPRILEWVAFPFCRGSSQPWKWTRVSCITS